MDSLSGLLQTAKTDTGRVILLWNMAVATYAYKPDTALLLAQEAIDLSRKIKYTEGESRALGILANSFLKIGNYPRALEFYLEKLKIEEKRNNPYNLASVTMNIGIVHVYQEEYPIALPYYLKADSIIRQNNITDLQYNIAVNLGDLYNKLNKNDLAFLYFNRSLDIARSQKNGDLMGSSMTGIGHSYVKAGSFDLAMNYYHEAMRLLNEANDEDIFCEAALGLAKLYELHGPVDSAAYYAHRTFDIAEKDGFLSWQLEASVFLNNHFKGRQSDSAYKYLQTAQILKDTLSSKARVRESQVLASNEQLRQVQLAQAVAKAKTQRSQQLQLLFIGIFIPGIFLFTVFLSKKKVNVKVIRSMGVISLLILFEYLTLLLHPQVLKLTNYTPVFEIMIFVGIAALLIPTHHRVEHWLISTLTRHHIPSGNGKLKLNIRKLKTKKPSDEAV